jgi:type I restriction enzyme, S subunit
MHEAKRSFGIQPKEWPVCSIGDVATRVDARNVEKNENVLTISAAHGLVSQQEFFNRRVASDDVRAYYVLQRGDFAYNKSYSRGYPFGVIRRLDRYDKGVVSPLYICFRADSTETDSNFLAHYFEAGVLDEGLGLIAKEGVRNHGLLNVGVGDFFRLQFALPPLSEQRQIAEVLDTVDDAIRKTEQIIAKLKQVKQGLLHDLLTRGIDDNGELRDPDRHPEQFKDSPLGRIPKGWLACELTSLAEIRSGIAKNSNRGTHNGLPVHYLRVANVQDGYLDLREMSLLRIEREELERFRVLPGDVLMNEGGDLDKLGRGALWRGEYDPCVHQNHVFVVRCGSRIRPEFLDIWTGSAVARRYFMKTGKQTTNLASINKTGLGKLPVPLCSMHEQDRITGVLAGQDKRISVEQENLRKLRLLKAGLMEDLLTGRVRVTPLLEAAAE